jgi:hypothetical protein
MTPKGERTARMVANKVSMCSGFAVLVVVCADVRRVCRCGRWERMSSLRGLMMEGLQKVMTSWVSRVVRERWIAWMNWGVR